MNSTTDPLLQQAVDHHLSGDIARAFELYAEILAIEPDHPTALVNQSAIFIDLEQPKEAVILLERAVTLAPDDIEAHNNYGNALQKLGQTEVAIEQFKLAHTLDPKNSTILSNLARALLRRGDYTKALAVLDQAIENDPGNAALRFISALALPFIPETLTQLEKARNRMASQLEYLAKIDLSLKDPVGQIGMTNFAAAYHGLEDREIQENLAAAYLKACPDLAFTAPHIEQPKRHEKTRIGFFSMHFGSHTIGKLNRRLITGLDRDKFEIFVFCPGGDKRGPQDIRDDILDEIAASVDHIFFPVPLLAASRTVIAEAALDILYYPDIGMEPLSYFLGFARLATIQCVTWGHPVTTGLSTIDYFISSELTEPEGAEASYTEKLVRLPGFSTDYPMPNLPQENKSRADFGLSATHNLYICPQSLFKFHPDFDEILASILRQDPKGEIILLEGQQIDWASRLQRRFENEIPDVRARIKFIPRLSGADYLQLISLADVVLDTPYFCGGNTSYEAFALGKIVVTLQGKFMRGRLTEGLYRQMRISDATAKNPEDYIEKAVKFALNTTARQQIEARISAAHPTIFGTNSALRTHETFLLEAIEKDRQ